MIEYTLKIGDVATSAGNANYTCYGLGSCIGLFVQDRITGLTGGAHIFLPDAHENMPSEGKFYDAVSALDEIMSQMKLNGSDLNTLRAKVTGGSNVLGHAFDTGERNVKSVVKILKERKIFIAAIDVGGNFTRTVRFESKTGVLTVKKSELDQIVIF